MAAAASCPRGTRSSPYATSPRRAVAEPTVTDGRASWIAAETVAMEATKSRPVSRIGDLYTNHGSELFDGRRGLRQRRLLVGRQFDFDHLFRAALAEFHGHA